MSKLLFALVLCDVGAHGLKAGQIVEASAKTINSIKPSGAIDDNKEAVAYARGQGAEVVRSSIELAAEARTATADALRVEIAKLEDLKSKAPDEATAAALTSKLADLQAQLAELG